MSGKRTKPHFRRGHRSLTAGSVPSKKRMGQPSSTSSITSLIPMSICLKRANVRKPRHCESPLKQTDTGFSTISPAFALPSPTETAEPTGPPSGEQNVRRKHTFSTSRSARQRNNRRISSPTSKTQFSLPSKSAESNFAEPEI